MVNYYQEFELDSGSDSASLCQALLKEKKKWTNRQNAADLERRQEAERKVTLVDEAMGIFADEESRARYDAELANEKRQGNTSYQNSWETQQAYQNTYSRQQAYYQNSCNQQQPNYQNHYNQQQTYSQNSCNQQQPNYQNRYNQQQTYSQSSYNQQQPNYQSSYNQGQTPNRSPYGNKYQSGSFYSGPLHLKDNTRLTGIVCYITWIGWFCAFFGGDRQGAKIHLNTALVLNLAGVIWYLVLAVTSSAGIATTKIVGMFLEILLAMLVFKIWGFIYAYRGVNKAPPLIEKIHLLK